MTSTSLTNADLEALRRHDTPTICNALEIVAPERRSTGFTSLPFVCADPALPPMVARARTATIRAIAASDLDPSEVKSKRTAYYEYVASGDEPTVVVMQDLDHIPGFGAFWGEVNSNVHKALGSEGVITNGSIRDLDVLASGFQLLAGVIGPSHAHVHVVDFGNQVNVHGMTVRHGDLIHADQHGAVVVPDNLIKEIPAAVALIEKREKVILDACKAPGFNIEVLKKALQISAEIH